MFLCVSINTRLQFFLSFSVFNLKFRLQKHPSTTDFTNLFTSIFVFYYHRFPSDILTVYLCIEICNLSLYISSFIVFDSGIF